MDKSIINCGAACKNCGQQTLHYGVERGSFTYYCNTCQKYIYNGEVRSIVYNLIEDRTWNGEGVIKHCTGTENACFLWIHNHTSFSYHEAITNQGYKLEKYDNQTD